MKLLNERQQVRDVAERWREQNQTSLGEHGRFCSAHKRLLALDADKATASDVAAIIGNDSWVKMSRCLECGVNSWDIVELGQESNYNSACICLDCLRKAAELAVGL